MRLEEAEVIRSGLRAMPKGGAASIGSPPRPEELYVLDAHAAAVDPDVSLVVGNRGMGKTFWANSLLNVDTRQAAAKHFRSNSGTDLERLQVRFGFSDREGVLGVSSEQLLEFTRFPSEAVWRGVLLHVMSASFGRPISFKDAVNLVIARPDDARGTLRRYNDILVQDGRKFLVLFDQLDQMDDNWPGIQRLSKGLLRTALAMKSYRSIRVKIFMRSDQFSDVELFDFADASKIYGEAVRLRWFATDLYGLVFTWLWRNPDSRGVLQTLLRKNGVSARARASDMKLPVSLEANPEAQGLIFDEIAGDKMGGGSKRGRPYSWIPTHLMDGMGEISPRSFMHALAVAAERMPESSQQIAIDYGRITTGVSSASESRRLELYEDYPWIREALEPLRDMTVPAKRAELAKRWAASRTPEVILDQHRDTKAPIELVTAAEDSVSRLSALERALEQVGVIQERDDARVNIPDIFRIAVGIKRKGGVKPQQRRRI